MIPVYRSNKLKQFSLTFCNFVPIEMFVNTINLFLNEKKILMCKHYTVLPYPTEKEIASVLQHLVFDLRKINKTLRNVKIV